jgi:glycosyltransferase involved in cell wall biosynthesis
LKILHLITSLKIGGAERALCALLSKMHTEQFQHHVAYFHDGPCRKVIEALGIPTYRLHGLLHRYDPMLYYRLAQLTQKTKPDVIHTSLWSANIIGRLIGHHYNIPVVSDLHGNCRHEGALRSFINRKTAHLSHFTIAVANTVSDTYRDHVINTLHDAQRQQILHHSLIVIQNGIDAHALRQQSHEHPLTRQELGIPDHTFVIGSVGRLEPIKSYDVLIKAFALLHSTTPLTRPLKLVLVGSGSQLEKLKELSQELGISRHVIFAGEQSNPARFYPLFNCFALSSQSEGISLALLEALSCGIPVVTTHADHNHDVITDGIHGFLVQPGDIRPLTRAFGILYQNPQLAEIIGCAGQILIDEKFSIDRVVAQYHAIFLEAYKNSTQKESV